MAQRTGNGMKSLSALGHQSEHIPESVVTKSYHLVAVELPT